MAKTNAAKAALAVDLDRARAMWCTLSGLAAPGEGTIDDVVAQTGWPRTLGGVDAYIAVRARVPAMTRADLEAAVETSKLQVLPAVRGCIYLVPRSEAALVLRVADEMARPRTMRELEKLGVDDEEVETIGVAVLEALAKGALSVDALRKKLPEGTVRSLGEKGKKLGVSSPLPAALRRLESEGKIERRLEGGRLDTERYLWRKTKKNPFTGAKLPADPIDRNAKLAKIFLEQAAPVTAQDFSAWSGFSVRDAKAAFERAGVETVAVGGYSEDACVLPEQQRMLAEVEPPRGVALLSFEDNYLTHHGGPGLLADPAQHKRKIPVWGSKKKSTLGEVKHMSMRSVIIGDRVAGFWEYDPDARAVIYDTFEKLSRDQKRALGEKAEAMTALLADDLGNAKSFSLDTMESIRERASLVHG